VYIYIKILLIATVYLETMLSKRSQKLRTNGFIALGFAYLAVSLSLITIDGGGMNPARSFGPAAISKARDCNNYKSGAVEVFTSSFF
jgi:glycerol uptake facilitator-like aquaporin